MKQCLFTLLTVCLLLSGHHAFAAQTTAETVPSPPTPDGAADTHHAVAHHMSAEAASLIPSAQEISAAFDASGVGEGDFHLTADIIATLSPEETLLQMGILAQYADEVGDASVLLPYAAAMYETVLPSLDASDFVQVLSDSSYPDVFRFLFIDMYSYSTIQGTSHDQTPESALIDATLLNLVRAGDPLTVDALLSIQDQTMITEDILLGVLADGTSAGQVVAMRLLSNLYPEAARTAIEAILDSEADPEVYHAALNFLPRLLHRVSDASFTEEYVISLLEQALITASSDITKLTCVQALSEIDHKNSAKVILENRDRLDIIYVELYAMDNIDLIRSIEGYENFSLEDLTASDDADTPDGVFCGDAAQSSPAWRAAIAVALRTTPSAIPLATPFSMVEFAASHTLLEQADVGIAHLPGWCDLAVIYSEVGKGGND